MTDIQCFFSIARKNCNVNLKILAHFCCLYPPVKIKQRQQGDVISSFAGEREGALHYKIIVDIKFRK